MADVAAHLDPDRRLMTLQPQIDFVLSDLRARRSMYGAIGWLNAFVRLLKEDALNIA